MVERTIRTIESLTRANLENGLTFEESVSMAIKTIRQTPHNTQKMTPFQLEKTTHANHQSDWSAHLPIIGLEENTNKLHFSTTCRATSFHDSRLRWRTGGLLGIQ